ncbi:response regulator transcription factor, partial [Mammaliicoccus vitulinus]
IVKPFDIEELLARIRVIIRRNLSTEVESHTITVNDLSIDKNAFSVSIHGETIDLTKTEYELLLLLAENQNFVLQREQILNHVWGYESEVETNVVDVYIRYLRNKLKPYKKENIIETVRGVGYVIRS